MIFLIIPNLFLCLLIIFDDTTGNTKIFLYGQNQDVLCFFIITHVKKVKVKKVRSQKSEKVKKVKNGQKVKKAKFY